MPSKPKDCLLSPHVVGRKGGCQGGSEGASKKSCQSLGRRITKPSMCAKAYNDFSPCLIAGLQLCLNAGSEDTREQAFKPRHNLHDDSCGKLCGVWSKYACYISRIADN